MHPRCLALAGLDLIPVRDWEQPSFRIEDKARRRVLGHEHVCG